MAAEARSARSESTGIGLLGLGVVGSAVARAIIERHRPDGPNVSLALKAVVVRDPEKKRAVELDRSIISTDAEWVIANPEVGIVVELMGGENPAF